MVEKTDNKNQIPEKAPWWKPLDDKLKETDAKERLDAIRREDK